MNQSKRKPQRRHIKNEFFNQPMSFQSLLGGLNSTGVCLLPVSSAAQARFQPTSCYSPYWVSSEKGSTLTAENLLPMQQSFSLQSRLIMTREANICQNCLPGVFNPLKNLRTLPVTDITTEYLPTLWNKKVYWRDQVSVIWVKKSDFTNCNYLDFLEQLFFASLEVVKRHPHREQEAMICNRDLSFGPIAGAE